MSTALIRRSGILLALLLLVLPVGALAAAEAPVRGGELTFVVPAAGFPSMDAHREETYAVIHPLRPFYSLLIKVDPNNPSDPTDFVGDVAESWHKSADGLVYTFTLRRGVKFHDGSLLTSRDVKASFDRSSSRPKAWSATARPCTSWSSPWRRPIPRPWCSG
jgi:peptide/nickel transport system substrate-binding protein